MPRIGTKLGAGIGILVALCVVIGLVAYTQSRLVASKIEEITEVTEPLNSTVYALENNLVETSFATLGYLSLGDVKLREAYEKESRNFGAIEERFHTMTVHSLERDPWRALQDRFQEFHTSATELMKLRDEQAQTMEALLTSLDAIDELLKGKIIPSIRPDDPVAYRRQQAALEMEVAVNALTKALGNFLLTGESMFEERVRSSEEDFRAYFTVYRNVLLSAEEADWTATLRRLSNKSLGLARVILDQEKKKNTLLGTFVGLHRDLASMLNDRIQPKTEKGLTEAKEGVLEAGKTANTTILFVLFVSVVFGLGAGFVTTRNITGPLRRLVSLMEDIARGSRMQKIVIQTGDELQSLGDSFNLMTAQLASAEQRRSEDLRRFAVSVQRVQEEERRRISRELHDDLCQRLSGMKFQVEAMEGDLPSAARRMGKGLRDFRLELERSITEVRRVSSDLRPSVLDDFGLVAALRILCKDFEKRHAVRTVFQVEDGGYTAGEPQLEIALYRIVQEALTNVARHAEASSVTVRLLGHGRAIQLIVDDDGKGFDPGAAVPRPGEDHGLGLINMRERTELLGGRCVVETAPNEGTTISVTIPVQSTIPYEEGENTHRG
jgi:signal transduction histidine kinase